MPADLRGELPLSPRAEDCDEDVPADVRRACDGRLRRPRDDDAPLLARSVTGAVMVTGTPDGACAPVIRFSSASPERTWAICGVIPASAIRRVISRR